MGNMDKLFRDGLYGYSPKAPPDGWQKLQNELSKSKRLPVIPVWLRIAASIILLAGATTLGWRYFTQSESEPNTQIAEEITVPEAPRSVAIEEEMESSGSSAVSVTLTSENAREIQSQENTIKEISIPVEFDSEKTEESYQLAESISIQLQDTPDEEEFILIRNPKYELDLNDLIIQRNLLALEENNTTKQKALWSVGGLAGPQYTYRDVTVNNMPYAIDDYDNYESGVTTYAGGFQIEVEPARRFSIQSGVYYSKIGQIKRSLQVAGIDQPWITGINQFSGRSRDEEDPPNDLVNSTGNITFDKSLPLPTEISGRDSPWVPSYYTVEQYFEFIEVPIIFRYRLIDRKFNMNISSGIWANFLIGNKATVTDNKTFNTSGTTDDINTFNYCGSLSMGFGYPISSKLALSLEPFFKYYLKPINSNPQTDVYPYSMGIMSGVKYLF